MHITTTSFFNFTYFLLVSACESKLCSPPASVPLSLIGNNVSWATSSCTLMNEWILSMQERKSKLGYCSSVASCNTAIESKAVDVTFCAHWLDYAAASDILCITLRANVNLCSSFVFVASPPEELRPSFSFFLSFFFFLPQTAAALVSEHLGQQQLTADCAVEKKKRERLDHHCSKSSSM